MCTGCLIREPELRCSYQWFYHLFLPLLMPFSGQENLILDLDKSLNFPLKAKSRKEGFSLVTLFYFLKTNYFERAKLCFCFRILWDIVGSRQWSDKMGKFRVKQCECRTCTWVQMCEHAVWECWWFCIVASGYVHIFLKGELMDLNNNSFVQKDV